MVDAPNRDDRIDLTRLSLDKIVEVLRILGLRLATMLLEETKRPVLSALLPPSLADLLLGENVTASLPTYSASWQPRLPWRWIGQQRQQTILSWLGHLNIFGRLFNSNTFVTQFTPTRLPSTTHYNDLVEQAAHDQITSSEWQREVNRRLSEALYGHPPRSLPHSLWLLLGKIAWNDLAVQRETGQRIYDYLRPRYLFLPEFGSFPWLSPQTFWGLIALTEPIPTGLPLIEEQRDCYTTAYYLQQIAREQIMVEGWANFWDQWLLWQAYHYWPAAFASDSEMIASLVNLPLFKKFLGELSVGSSDQNATEPCGIAAPNWHAIAPSWLLKQKNARKLK